jgi:purine-binding chemotaxis protein CheW
LAEPAGGGSACLIVRTGNFSCALPLAHVMETMRRLPIEPLAGVPPYVRGVSIVRGTATPVVDLGDILGVPESSGERFVVIRVGEKQVALAVDSVLGVREIDLAAFPEVPPLLRRAPHDLIEAIGALDGQFLTVLRSGWELPEEVWQALTAQAVAS